jgi:AcrR family transcriptional regulator
MAVKTAREARAPLTRDRILETAMALADTGGLDAVTMRGIAQELDVEAMSLYHHASSKDDILGGIADLVIRQIELPSPDGDWKQAVRASAVSAYAVLRQHQWACALLMSANHVVPSRMAMIDALLARLADANLPDDVLDLAYHALDSHIIGFTMWHAGYAQAMPKMEAGDLERFIKSLNLEAYPHLVEHAAWHVNPPVRPRKPAFEFGLDLILDGIAAA